MTAKRLLGIGSPLLDILSEVGESFLMEISGGKGGRERLDGAAFEELIAKLPGYRVCPGGEAGNVVAALSQLGGNAAFFGLIGADEAGQMYRKEMQRTGCDVPRMIEDEEHPTGRCISLITPDGERTMRVSLGASAQMGRADAEKVDFSAFPVVFVEGYQLSCPEFFSEIILRAHKAGCQVALDLASYEVVLQNRSYLLALWEKGAFDLLFANRAEAEALLGKMPQETLALRLAGDGIAVLKDGAAGAWIARGGKTVFIPAEKVDVCDSTGAGDLFAAGFFYGYLQDLPLPVCGAMGAAMAGEVVQHIGAAIPPERYPALRTRLNKILNQPTQ